MFLLHFYLHPYTALQSVSHCPRFMCMLLTRVLRVYDWADDRQASSSSPPRNRTEHIQQIRARLQQQHRARNGVYPVEDLQEQTELRIQQVEKQVRAPPTPSFDRSSITSLVALSVPTHLCCFVLLVQKFLASKSYFKVNCTVFIKRLCCVVAILWLGVHVVLYAL